MSPSEIPVREATVADAPTIARLLHDFNTEFEAETPGVEALTRHATRMLRERAMTVLLGGEDPVGLALLRFRPSVWTEKSEAYLQELYVAPARRGEGIGQALLEAAIAASRAAGAAWIELNTAESDRAARSLYAKLGFTNEEGPDGATMLYYELEL
jgi:ribosomal protein S18 acetylase RimI-like enzyme